MTLVGVTGVLTSCGGEVEPETPPSAVEQAVPAAMDPPGPPEGSLEWALDGSWRPVDERARDAALKPDLVLGALAIPPDATVIELWPGAGYYTAILGPYLTAGGGRYIAAQADLTSAAEAGRALRSLFAERFSDHPMFAGVVTTTFPSTGEPSSVWRDLGGADLALSLDGVHAWMALGQAEMAFADVFEALRPGGRLVVMEARADNAGVQDPGAPTGYVQPRYVEALASDAGFVLVSQADVLDNPADTADHPFGVWTLPQFARTSPLGEEPDPAFDRTAYDRIGEPRRMLLIFEKPSSVPPGVDDSDDG